MYRSPNGLCLRLAEPGTAPAGRQRWPFPVGLPGKVCSEKGLSSVVSRVISGSGG
jgi:hypothetical protein